MSKKMVTMSRFFAAAGAVVLLGLQGGSSHAAESGAPPEGGGAEKRPLRGRRTEQNGKHCANRLIRRRKRRNSEWAARAPLFFERRLSITACLVVLRLTGVGVISLSPPSIRRPFLFRNSARLEQPSSSQGS